MNSYLDKLEILLGDITTIDTEAIVNSANKTLLGGGGVDGAIHRAAGPKLLEECKLLGGCETGKAKITKAYNLPSKFVIHAVGPIWYGGTKNEELLLESTYQSCLELAQNYNITSISFPSISTGVYLFPIDLATKIAVRVILNFLKSNKSFQKVNIVCFNKDVMEAYIMAKQLYVNDLKI